MRDDRKPSGLETMLALLTFLASLTLLACAPAIVIAVWRWAL